MLKEFGKVLLLVVFVIGILITQAIYPVFNIMMSYVSVFILGLVYNAKQ